VFQHWLSTEFSAGPKLLWVNGPAGFGKSILCAHVVEHLSSTLDTPVAHFFFTSDNESREDPFLALRLWISQIVSRHEGAFEHVR
jgi:Ni2+-binding GTPase involved in maturation of urease and hydrogenase